MAQPDHFLIHDDTFEALQAELPLASREFLETLTNAVITKLDTEGWLIEQPICQYGNAAKTVVCERPTRPGSAYCPEHGN